LATLRVATDTRVERGVILKPVTGTRPGLHAEEQPSPRTKI